MPCNCDHMEPTALEAESKRVAQLLQYVYGKRNVTVPKYVTEASNRDYGNVDLVHEMTAMLCELCLSLSNSEIDEIIYNGRSKEARGLADWWDDHQEVDRKRLAKEARELKLQAIRKVALKKLTKEERSALGISQFYSKVLKS